MDPVEIQRLVDQLKLSEEADQATVPLTSKLTEQLRDKTKFCLAGKVFANKQINRDLLVTHLPNILQTTQRVDIEIVGSNIFVAHFKSIMDKKYALNGGPWHFFHDLLLFSEIEGFQNPSEVKFENFTGWIQCHNLPVACMHPEVIKRIGEQIGSVLEVDLGADGLCLGRFARVRVSWLLSRPLQRCIRLLPDGEMEEAIIILLYEKIPNFCFKCGKIGHLYRFCDESTMTTQEMKYGTWLMAPKTFVPSRKAAPNNQHTSGVPSQSKSEQGDSHFQVINVLERSSPTRNLLIVDSIEPLMAKAITPKCFNSTSGDTNTRSKTESGGKENLVDEREMESDKGGSKGGDMVVRDSPGRRTSSWKRQSKTNKVISAERGGRGGRGKNSSMKEKKIEAFEQGNVGYFDKADNSTLEPISTDINVASTFGSKKRNGDLVCDVEIEAPCLKHPRLTDETDMKSTAEAAEQPRRSQ
ncbi:uncharacterized protein LOC131009066 [Salvia miltiorrhiza]|uniref:uncharacterized protein LOC131009066 n=1 Tax=Salvia miltiorrhiza TaxID=226208 RepID=UPI0025AD5379|nr:uncharacterized protein LOC131009066 [Salvia miltiorrhiza]